MIKYLTNHRGLNPELRNLNITPPRTFSPIPELWIIPSFVKIKKNTVYNKFHIKYGTNNVLILDTIFVLTFDGWYVLKKRYLEIIKKKGTHISIKKIKMIALYLTYYFPCNSISYADIQFLLKVEIV